MARRALGLLVVFSLGIGVGMWMLRASFRPALNDTEAQRRAVRILSQTPVAMGIGDNRIVAAVQRIEPAVVNIDTVGRVHADDDSGSTWLLDQEVRGKGSGVILTPDGYIVTNNHVIEGANRILVTLPDNRWFYARLVGRDPQTDLAVVRVEAHDLPSADLGDSDKLQVGEWCIAVGNPLGLGSTVTAGIVSALNRHNLQIDETHTLDGAIQTDAAINRGNSGGALANINGQLIGINTAILSSGPSGGNIGLGFSIPVNTVRRVSRDLIASGKSGGAHLKRPWLGIAIVAVPPDIAQELGLSAYQGVMIGRAQPASPASLAGIEDNDILLTIDGKSVNSVNDVRNIVSQHKIGDSVVVRILRATRMGTRLQRDFHVTLAENPNSVESAR